MSTLKYLAIIPARAGSKGLPGKNTKLLAGKPLIQWTIEAALDVFDKADICISTDDNKVIEIATNLGIDVPFTRPHALATDTATTHDVIKHAVGFYMEKGITYDAIVLLQPTSPLRKAKNIKEAIALFGRDLDMVVSVKETDANPYYVLFEEDKDGFLKKSKEGTFTRRQDCPKVWEYNGAIYVINTKKYTDPKTTIDRIVKYEMSSESSFDIDTMLDFKIVNTIISEK